MTGDLMDEIPGSHRIVAGMKNSQVYLAALLGWTLLFQLGFYAATTGWATETYLWLTVQFTGFVLSSNLAAEGFTFYSRVSSVNKRFQLTGNMSRILGLPIYYVELFVAVAGTIIITLAVNVQYGDIMLTMWVLIAATNAAYVIWGYLSYREMEIMGGEIRSMVGRSAPPIPVESKPRQIQEIRINGDLDG